MAAIAAVTGNLRIRFDVPMGITIHLNGVVQALGDGIIVTGIKTGVAPQRDDIMSIRDACK